MDRTELLNRLFRDCEGKLELRALPSGKRAFFNLDELSGIEAFCDANRDENLHFGVATRDGRPD